MRAFPSSQARTPHDSPITAAADDSAAFGSSGRRAGLLAGVALLVASVAVVFAPAASAASATPVLPESLGARLAVESTVGQQDPALIPADFATSAGYRPVLSDGILVNPNGDCSSPVPLPAEFDLACKAHDLGYDLLRYAGDHGEPLGPWARQSLDAALEQRMHAACAARTETLARTQCQVMASIATAAVDLNSIRQDYGVPVHETLLAAGPDSPSPLVRILQVSGIAFLLAGITSAITVFTRRMRARRNERRNSPEVRG
ncbi:hypothetical protein LTV02_00595 [Nocardia yamanashiensis]|uniref:hypothetical protein n=1 Tax=Nocardia yamanashiensis TaxID=209247 RepID=UPI001E4C1747|nr:hypothetical protein [Nocardia yamanashiensis]UGT41964.1 hypothetical protein LTV02_00595 [Nocardia yamanashiensis]